MKKTLLLLTTALALNANAQQIPDWQNKDLQTDSLFGISTHKAYALLKGKKAKTVIVAVIDAGVDTSHEDLKNVLWHNPKKKPGDNGTYGWSYIGKTRYDNLELTRQVRQHQQKGDTATTLYRTEKAELDKKLKADRRQLNGVMNFVNALNAITQKMGKTNPTLADFQAYQPQGAAETQVTKTLIHVLSQKDDFAAFKKEQIDPAVEHYKASVDYQLNTAYDPRSIVGDDYFNSQQRSYGSPDNNGPDPTHGTHVAGIIAAQQNNGIGIDGIADHVQYWPSARYPTATSGTKTSPTPSAMPPITVPK